LQAISEAEFLRLSRVDPLVFGERAQRELVLEVRLSDARLILDSLVKGGYGPMELVAHPFFISDPRILYFPRDTLTVLYKEFFVSTLFAVNGHLPRAVTNEQTEIPAGTYFEQEGLPLDQGRVVHLYHFHISVKRTERNYAFFTGAYDFSRVNVMDIKSTPEDFILLNLRGRDRPKDGIHFLRDPSMLALRNLECQSLKTKWQSIRAFLDGSFRLKNIQKIYHPDMSTQHLKQTFRKAFWPT